MNRQIAQVYLTAADLKIAKRSWRYTLEELIKTKGGENANRWRRVAKDRALRKILDMPLVEIRPEQFLDVLNEGTVSTNVFLRRPHDFALGLGWRLAPVLPPRQWRKVRHKTKRAITRIEHDLKTLIHPLFSLSHKIFYATSK